MCSMPMILYYEDTLIFNSIESEEPTSIKNAPISCSFPLVCDMCHPNPLSCNSIAYFPFEPSHERYPGKFSALADRLLPQLLFRGQGCHRETRTHLFQGEVIELDMSMESMRR